QIVGGADTEGDLTYHAFVRNAGSTSLSDLGTLGGASSEARGINVNGTIVGYADTAASGSHAFVDSGRVMYDLNNLIPSNSGWTLTAANAINDSEQIVGMGTNSLGQSHGFL